MFVSGLLLLVLKRTLFCSNWAARLSALRRFVVQIFGQSQELGVLSHHLRRGMESPHLVDFS